MGSKVPLLMRATRAARPFRLFLYLAPIVLLTALAVAFLLVYCRGVRPGSSGASCSSPSSVLSAASALVVPIVNMLITLTVPPRTLPRLDFSDGIPADHRTMVVVPTLLGSRRGRLRIFWKPWRYAISAIVTPTCSLPCSRTSAMLPSAPSRATTSLIDLARAGIEALNDTYSEDRPSIFYLFHRPRVWNPHDRVWMGYERKRGKLEQFNALLLEARSGRVPRRPGPRAGRTRRSPT